MAKRDDFTRKTKLILAQRTGYLCSNPVCGAWTSGPNLDTADEILFYGRAAHITAAAPGGPRYDPTLSSEKRRSIENGIYLCDICATTIDEEESEYPVSLLLNWKRKAEHKAYEFVSTRRNPGSSNPILVSPPSKLGKQFAIDLDGEQTLCSKVLDDFSEPWFFDDTAMVYRFVIARNPEYKSNVLLNQIVAKVHAFEKPEDVGHPMFPMGARCIPCLFQIILGDPGNGNTDLFTANEIGADITYPTPIMLDEHPTVVDVRIDTKTQGLYTYSLNLVASTANRNFDVPVIDHAKLYYFA